MSDIGSLYLPFNGMCIWSIYSVLKVKWFKELKNNSCLREKGKECSKIGIGFNQWYEGDLLILQMENCVGHYQQKMVSYLLQCLWQSSPCPLNSSHFLKFLLYNSCAASTCFSFFLSLPFFYLSSQHGKQGANNSG